MATPVAVTMLDLAAPSLLGCAVCGLGPETGSAAFLAMSVVLSLLPLAAIGGVAAFIAVRVARAERSKAAGLAAEAVAPRPAQVTAGAAAAAGVDAAAP